MKKTIYMIVATLVAVFCYYPIQAQQKVEVVKQYLLNKKGDVQISKEDIANMKVSSTSFSQMSGLTHIYFQQHLNGIPVHNAILNAHVNKGNEVVSLKSRFVDKLSVGLKNGASLISPADAIRIAIEELNIPMGPSVGNLASEEAMNFEIIGKSEEGYIFDKQNYAAEDILVRQVYQPMAKGGVMLAWEVNLYEIGQQNFWQARIDAEHGYLLDQNNLVVSCSFDHEEGAACMHSHQTENNNVPNYKNEQQYGAAVYNSAAMTGTYNVYAMPLESPAHGGRTLEVDPADPTASPFGWHDTDGIAGYDYTITRGNNVNAYEDGDNQGFSPDGGPGLNFDFPVNTTYSGGDQSEAAAITNLFYWSNVIHDLSYQYGFDEANGNFQVNNYGNGGAGNDAVNAEAQDGAGVCNANMFTPADGSSPRMQMFICNSRDGDFDNGVIAHEYAHGISNRLTGGPATAGCLSNSEQMGEGWSDWLGYVMTIRSGDTGADARGIGTWLFGQPLSGPGIRTYPYTTDMAVNPHTYDDIKTTGTSPHRLGEIWGVILWDVTWALIDQYGFDTDFYNGTGGNNMAMHIIIEGMKLQPCGPGFVDGRDAILLADQNLYGGANQCLLWEAFARRGLGFSADQGSSNSRTDGSEAFDVNPSCFLNVSPEVVAICTGDAAEFTINTGENFSAPITLSTTGEPAGTTVSFTVNPIAPGTGISIMTISNTGAVAPGSYMITVSGDDGSLVKTLDVELIVYDAAPAATVLAAPANATANLSSLNPSLSWIADPNASTYEVELATDMAFANVLTAASGLTTNSWTVDQTLNSLTTYYWRVKASNSCGTGTFSGGWSFTTSDISCIQAAGSNLPVVIETVNPNTIVSTALVTACGTITDVNVTGLDIQHSATVDLDIYLTSPSGTIIHLMSRPCGSNILINFDDMASSNVIPCPATDNGSYQPVQPLSNFNGENAIGLWTLTVIDRDFNDGGSLDGWNLDICLIETGATSVTCYRDQDGDSFGNPDEVNAFCDVCQTGWVLDNSDCNDDPSNGGTVSYPGNQEICFDGFDNDCDGSTDEDCCPSGTIIYVNSMASGANDGSSWADALTDFQTALKVGRFCAGVSEIWVAEGTYQPSLDQAGNSGVGRNATFYIDYEIAIFGGFPNAGNPGMNDRNPLVHTTVLTGDIGMVGNDSDNAYTIVYTRNVTDALIIDGFEFSDGNANIFANFPSAAGRGGAVFNDGYNGNFSNPTFRNCQFINNNSRRFGGAIYNNGSAGTSLSTFINCAFIDNTSGSGGAFYENGNSSGNCSTTYTNCVFAGNEAEYAGAILVDGSSGSCTPNFTNCSFGGNVTQDGSSGAIQNLSGEPTLINCILWANSFAQISESPSNVERSIVQGGYPGNMVLDVDPQFEDLANNNLRLLSCSPALDFGDDSAAGLVGITTDLDGNNRFFDAAPGLNVVDLGAYELTSLTTPVYNCFMDVDEDGFGDPNSAMMFCVPCSGEYVTNGDDCDDNSDVTFPGAAENESSTACMKDADGDGYGDDNPSVGILAGTDCEDDDATIFPGAILKPVNEMGYQICAGGTVPPGEGLRADPAFNVPTAFSDAPALEITDNDAAGVATTIYVPYSFDVTSMTVDLNITHTWVGDLNATLTAPDGTTTVQLFDRPGNPVTTFGCSGDDLAVNFDDQATQTADDFENACNNLPAISGSYQSIDLLSAFNGVDSKGNWTLTVSDNANADFGTIEDWSLTFEGFSAISWWDAPMGGTKLGEGSPFDPTTIPVGSGGVDPNVSGANTYWAQLEHSITCVTDERVPVDFQVGLIKEINSTSETCAGAADGTISILADNPFGGQIGYSLDGGINFVFDPDFEDLSVGTYDIHVKIFGGSQICESTAVVEILGGTAPTIWYKDQDGDGYSDGTTITACDQPAGYIANPAVGTDCNDADAAIHPGASELCDGVDNNCDGSLLPDEMDMDGDGYMVCEGDCDDSNPAVYPGAVEICDGLDNDCNMMIDDGVSETYVGNVVFASQADIDAWPACYTTIQGDLLISGANITDLGPLSNITTVTGTVTIYFNSGLGTLNGLEQLSTVGGAFYMYYNFTLTDCCAIDDLLTNGGVSSAVVIFFNGGANCNSAAAIMAACPMNPLLENPNNNLSTVAVSLPIGKEMLVYPNPAGEQVTVLFTRNAPSATLRITDLLGRVVLEEDLEEGVDRLTLNLYQQSFENGIYLVSLLEDGKQVTQQMVIQQ